MKESVGWWEIHTGRKISYGRGRKRDRERVKITAGSINAKHFNKHTRKRKYEGEWIEQ